MSKSKQKKQCPECGRTVPIKKARFVKHYIQDKGWQRSDGGRDICDQSGRPWRKIAVFESAGTGRWSFGVSAIYKDVPRDLCNDGPDWERRQPRVFDSQQKAIGHAESLGYEVVN